MFFPQQIIFSATDACNLYCKHCFVNRTTTRLSADAAINFLNSCIDYNNSTEPDKKKGSIEKIGFSGGEPFLYLEFLTKIIEFAVKNDFLFDQIMTNGDWWKTELELEEKLQALYDAGYDGKIGLSWDSFHAQTTERMVTFIKAVQKLFGENAVVIQSVEKIPEDLVKITKGKSDWDITPPKVYVLPQTYPSTDSRAWKSFLWFKDDYCEGPGQILFIHPDGNIAPCCGFANEDPELFIGSINQSFSQVLKNAESNPMIKICYETGLKNHIKELKKKGTKFPGKTRDICSFCDYICKNKLY